MGKSTDDSLYGEEETARRRDQVIRKMANTPPQHKTASKPRKTVKKKPPAKRKAK